MEGRGRRSRAMRERGRAAPGARGGRAAERRARAPPPAAAANRSQGATPCRAFLKIDPETVRK
ncbi:hypothetical protein AQ769_05560 [Burkholderia pseudomallei]|nr:hypothetical protein AQ769_05560 [Burkholderia pseudomallei]